MLDKLMACIERPTNIIIIIIIITKIYYAHSAINKTLKP